MKLQGTPENIKIIKSYLKTIPLEVKQRIEKEIHGKTKGGRMAPTIIPWMWSVDGTVLECGVLNCDQFVKRPALKIFIHSGETCK